MRLEIGQKIKDLRLAAELTQEELATRAQLTKGFISQIENYERFVKISDVKIKAGDFDEDVLRSDVVHNISMLVETYVYQGNQAGELTQIQGYEKKRESLIDEIKSVRNEIVFDRFEYVYDPSVRDPFIDPRQWASKDAETEGLELKEQEKFITEVMDRISEIKGLLTVVKDSVNVPLWDPAAGCYSMR